MKSKAKRIAKYTLFVLLGMVILLNCITFVLSELGLRSRLSWIPGALFRVETGSMEPELYAGDLMFIWRTPVEELQVGDTVTVYDNGEYTTHRIVRLADDEIVTKGLVNVLEDSPVKNTAYIGKKICSWRGLGDVYEALTSTAACIATVLCIVLLFLAKPLYRWMRGKTQGLSLGAVRVLCGLLCVSLAILPPVSTLAKFTGIVSAGKTVAAAEINFTSNYLTADGNTYDIIGWSGDEYPLKVDINNFGNALKYNREDVDFSYEFQVEKIASDAIRMYSLDYRLEVKDGEAQESILNEGVDPSSVSPSEKPPQTIMNESGVPIGSRLRYFHINGGKKIKNTFTLLIDGKSGEDQMSLVDGQKIKFRVIAKTSETEGYFQTISAEFTMTVTTAEYFIKESILDSQPGNAVVHYSAKSATLIGVPSQKVMIQWDPALLYMNEYDTTFWNLDHNHAGDTVYSYDRENGKLSFMMYATSSMEFEFFRKSNMLNVNLQQRRESVDPDGVPKNGNEYELVRIWDASTDTPPANADADKN